MSVASEFMGMRCLRSLISEDYYVSKTSSISGSPTGMVLVGEELEMLDPEYSRYTLTSTSSRRGLLQHLKFVRGFRTAQH